MKSFFSLLGVVFLLFGCATMEPITTEQYSKIKKIGVISLVGDKIEFNYFGPTIFNNKRNEFDIGISVDQYLMKTIKTEIGVDTPIKVVDVEYDRKILEKVYESHRKIGGSYIDLSLIKNDLKIIATDNSLDAILLVIKTRGQSADQHIDGFGVLERSIVIYKECHAHMFAWVLLVDTNNIEHMTHFSIYNNEEIGKKYCPGKMNVFSSDQIAFISDWIKSESQKRIHDGLISIGIKKNNSQATDRKSIGEKAQQKNQPDRREQRSSSVVH